MCTVKILRIYYFSCLLKTPIFQASRSQSRRLRAGSMGPPPPPKAPLTKTVTDSTFLEKLHAVEEELAVCMDPYQVSKMDKSVDRALKPVGGALFPTVSDSPCRGLKMTSV